MAAAGPTTTRSPSTLFLRLGDNPIPAWVWIIGLWFVMVFPAIWLRGAHFEEGTVVALARSALEGGHWLEPHRYGIRFVERPVLLSWMIAAAGMITGNASLMVARGIQVLFLLAGGGLVFRLVQPQAGKAAALFGVLCWFATPMVALKLITAEPDVTVSVLLFAAFTVWWEGENQARVSPARWMVVALALTAASLTKGPQPLGYFVLGVGAYIMLKQRWRQIPGFIAAILIALSVTAAWYMAVDKTGDASGWLHHSRIGGLEFSQWIYVHIKFVITLFFQWLPGSLLLIPAFRMLAKRHPRQDSDLLLATVLYATLCSVALLFWPGGVSGRYAMPSSAALAVMCGLLFAAWQVTRPKLIATCAAIVIAMSAYLIVLGWIAMPLLPSAFRQSKIAAQIIQSVRPQNMPLYVTAHAFDHDVLVYLESPIRELPIEDLKHQATPFMAALSPEDVAQLIREAPQFIVTPRAVLPRKPMSQVVAVTLR